MIHLTVQQLSASLDGALTGPSLDLVVRHLAVCHDCRDRQARLVKHDDALRRLLAQEPQDLFLDDLTRRTEALVTAISRGIPAPIMVTSVPLLHEEDPYAPVEPPPLPARPELGKSGEIAKEAGWGRIGIKPTASTTAPHSDPEEAQRMLEALASGNTDDFTELTAQGAQEHVPVDGPVFDLPAWIKDPAGRGTPRADGPREVPKLSLFFEQLDENAAGLTREAVNEVFRREEQPVRPPFSDGSATPERLDHAEPPVSEPLPPEHAAYAPPGWGSEYVAPESGLYAQPEWNAALPPEDPAEYVQPSWNAEYLPLEPVAHSPAGWNEAYASPADPSEVGWSPDPATPDAYPVPIIGDFGNYRPEPEASSAPRTRRGPAMDRTVVLALASICTLLLIVLALQLVPPAPRHPAHPGSLGSTGEKLPAGQATPPRAQPDSSEVIILDDTDEPIDIDAPAMNPITDEPAPVRAPVTAPVLAPVKPKPHVTNPAPRSVSSISRTTPAKEPVKGSATTVATATEEPALPLLCGQIVDDSGQPVANARVSMAEFSFATRTDSRGHFCVSAPAGRHSLFIEASGFTPHLEPVSISATSMDVQIRLQPAR